MTKNTANINCLNEMNKTALYYATQARKKAFGWGESTGNIMDFQKMMTGDHKTKQDREMKRLQKKVTRDEIMLLTYEARRRKSKQPCSLTLE